MSKELKSTARIEKSKKTQMSRTQRQVKMDWKLLVFRYERDILKEKKKIIENEEAILHFELEHDRLEEAIKDKKKKIQMFKYKLELVNEQMRKYIKLPNELPLPESDDIEVSFGN